MPKVGGLELAQQLKAQFPEINLIFASRVYPLYAGGVPAACQRLSAETAGGGVSAGGTGKSAQSGACFTATGADLCADIRKL